MDISGTSSGLMNLGSAFKTQVCLVKHIEASFWGRDMFCRSDRLTIGCAPCCKSCKVCKKFRA